MNINRLNSKPILIFLFITAAILCWYFQDYVLTKGIAVRQETPDWADWKSKLPPETDFSELYYSKTDESKPGILLRYSEENAEVLLLKHTIGDGVYFYDLNANKTGRTNEKAWKEAKGEITVCEKQKFTRPGAFGLDYINNRLMTTDNSSHYSTYGRYALDAYVTPSKSKAAVLSAYGPRTPFINYSYFGFGSADYKIYGQKYIQMIDLKTEKYIDKPVRINSELNEPYYFGCWSSDAKILIVYLFSHFQIIEPFK